MRIWTSWAVGRVMAWTGEWPMAVMARYTGGSAIIAATLSTRFTNSLANVTDFRAPEFYIMAEISRNRRNTLERKCLPKALKRLFRGSTRTTFKMLEKVKPTKNAR